jgi:hypothetical protein
MYEPEIYKGKVLQTRVAGKKVFGNGFRREPRLQDDKFRTVNVVMATRSIS